MTANEVMAKLTLEEKASLLCGKNFWQLKGIERLGLPPVFVADGPHGLRKQTDTPDHLGIHGSLPATCFPTACAVACSFDRRLASEIGKAMAEEALEQKVSVILGPGVNIKRNPLCGRNFEYFSEDPYTAGEMGAAIIDGIQSKETGTSLKHFAANNQEKARFYNNSVIDERAFREIYLAPFEKAVKKARPWTVMCSYNRINGVQASKNKLLLTGILRDEWGFRGLVMSDWGATSNRVDGVDAGLDLEMPFSGFWNEKQIVRAVRKGTLPAETVDKATLRAVELILKARSALDAHVDFRCDMTAHHALARRASAESAVLLKNESAEPGGTSPSAKSGVLPISPGQSIAVIGAFAKNPRYQGAGSSRVNPASLDNAFDALRGLGADAEYAAGYALGPESTDIGGALIAEAVLLAGKKDAAVIFAGLPDEYESEGYDRTDMDLPKSHNELIEAVAAANPNTVVVLQLGSPVIMPWASKVRAILVAYLGGQAGGGGIADVLLGRVNPGGKLAETWPLSLAGVPSYRYFGGDKVTEYRESIFAGYRYYDTAGAEPAYPFGHGLSYTGFTYSDLRLNQSRFKPGETVTAGLTVHNSGNYDGAEIVQLYIEREGDSKIFRAKKELKGFEKVFLKSGESTDVNFTLDDRSFAY
jgi:beta-glucosidase